MTEPTAVSAVRALARMSRLLERAGDELNLAHYRVLSAIAAGDQRASRVADRLALGKPTVSAAVDSLWRRGLLQRADVADDQRAAALSLTPAGQQLLDRVEAAMAARIVDLCERTGDGAAVLAALAGLDAALDEVATERQAARAGGPAAVRLTK